MLVAPTLHCREFSCCFSSITMWGINIIELGLYISRMSLLKCSRSSWGCTPTSSIGELSYTYSSMCIRCIAITTPHSVSTTRFILVLWLPSSLSETFFLAFQTSIIILFAIIFWCQIHFLLALVEWTSKQLICERNELGHMTRAWLFHEWVLDDL